MPYPQHPHSQHPQVIDNSYAGSHQQHALDADAIADRVVMEMYGRHGMGLDDVALVHPASFTPNRYPPMAPTYGALAPPPEEKTRGETFWDRATEGAGVGLGFFGVFFLLGTFVNGLRR